MALAVKAIPTLYGDEAREFRYRADEVERRFMEQPRPAVYFVYVYYVIILLCCYDRI